MSRPLLSRCAAALAGLALALPGAAAAGILAQGAATPVLAVQPAPAQTAASQQVLVLFQLPPDHVRAGGEAGGGYADTAGHAARRRMAAKLADAYGLRLVDGWPMPLVGVDCFIMSVPAGRSPEEVATRLAREPGVQRAQASHMFHTQGVARFQPAALRPDPLFLAQPAARQWRLADLHEIATGKGVRVAVIDSMVDAAHPDLAGQVQVSRNFVAGVPAVAEDHGTGVAGVIAAREGNGVGIVGVAPRARLLALRACWQLPAEAHAAGGTVCDSLSLAKALHFAIDNRAQVINLSLSGPPDPLLGRLIDVATARGITVVAAYDRKQADGGFPASHPGVVAVADQSLAPPPPGVYSAPGRDVPTTQPGGRWSFVDGSSYAAAHVSGLVALVSEQRPLEQRALSLVAARSGGEIDACASLVRVSGRDDCACARSPGPPKLAR